MIILDIETTGLNPYEHHIVTIQMKVGDEVKMWRVWEMKENEVIVNFLKELKKLDKWNDTIFGFNNLKFDVPFIIGRLNELGMMDKETYELLHNQKWFDLYQFLGDNYKSQVRWLEEHGIKRKVTTSGRDIPILFEKKKYKEIEVYALDELDTAEKLVAKLSKKFPEVFSNFNIVP